MSTRAVIVVGVVLMMSGCATFHYVRPVVIDEYSGARVRVYRAGDHCRIEVITPTHTIQTLPTYCWAVPTILRTVP